MTEQTVIEESFHRTWLKRLLHTLCLLLPIAAAFTAYFVSDFVGSKIFKLSDISENFKFFLTLGFFLLTSLIIFIATRGENPVMTIRIFSNKKGSPSQKEEPSSN